MEEVAVVAAENAASAAVRQMMAPRDAETQKKFQVIYGDSLASTQARLTTALASPTIKTPQAYTVNFREFLSSGNSPFPYAAPPLITQINTLPKTPADDLLYSGHAIHSGGIWWESSQLVDISYNRQLEDLGMSHSMWTADVVAPIRVISKQALDSRTQLGCLLRASSAASWTIRLSQGTNHCQVWVSNRIGLGAEEKDRSTFADYVICACLIPFRAVSCIATTPLFLIMWIFTVLLGALADLMSCYSCRIDTPRKLEAITKVLQAHPHLDEKSLSDKTHGEMQQLALALSAKYGPRLTFEAIVTAELVEGQYFKKYVPTHALVRHSLAIFAAGDSRGQP